MQHTLPKQGSMERPPVGQGRAGSKRKKPDPINHAINQASNLSQKIPGRTEIETKKKQTTCIPQTMQMTRWQTPIP